MVQYTNFYETLKEAEMRLLHTAVLYDNEPYVVIAITDHKPDGIFRVYLDPYPLASKSMMHHQRCSVPYEWHPEGGVTRGMKMDKYLEETKDCPIIRKQMSSPLFNKFRPFPLGMANVDNGAYYLARSPTRQTQQGLMDNGVAQHRISIGQEHPSKFVPSRGVSFYGSTMRDTIKGIYPSIEETVEAFSDSAVTNEVVGFTRDFALAKGPMDILFLAYKTDIVGYLPNGDLSSVLLGNKFKHTKEVVEELNCFNTIAIKK